MAFASIFVPGLLASLLLAPDPISAFGFGRLEKRLAEGNSWRMPIYYGLMEDNDADFGKALF